MAAGAAAFQQQARSIEVDTHSEIEIRFGLAADNCRQVKDGGRLRRDHSLKQSTVGDVAGDLFNPRVVETGGGDHVDQDDLADGLQLAATVRQAALPEQAARQALA